MRLFAISDLHIDYQDNWNWCLNLSLQDYQHDTVVIAGDVTSDCLLLGRTFEQLRKRFKNVFFVPGNHDLWTETENQTSLQKFRLIEKLCNSTGTDMRPKNFGNITIAPLFSWYDGSLEEEESIPFKRNSTLPQVRGWSDYRRCRWNEETLSPAELFHAETLAQAMPLKKETLVTVSHFVPRRDLLPPSQFLRFKSLPSVAGSTWLEKQIREQKSDIHIFGHSHIPRDTVINGVRYLHNPLGYPRERDWLQCQGLAFVLDSGILANQCRQKTVSIQNSYSEG